MKFPKTTRTKLSASKIESMTLGLVHRQFTKYRGFSKWTEQYPKLFELLAEYGRSLSDLPFTTITINKNVLCPPHKDSRNVGLTMIIGLGDYVGGELVVKGEHIDIHGKPYYFNGYLDEHYNLPWTGDRYSLMFYKFRTTAELCSRVEDIPIIKEVYYGNAYHKHDISFGIERGDNWLDFGAHIGCFAKKCIENGATVMAYEPDPNSFSLLKQNVGEQNCTNAAVGLNTKSGSMKPGSRHYFDSVLDIPGDVSIVGFNTLDLLDKCIKMDIEGAEMDILDHCDFTGIKKMVIAYHTNRDRSVDNFHRRVDRLKQSFLRVDHQIINAVDTFNQFPNEIFIYCHNKARPKPVIRRK